MTGPPPPMPCCVRCETPLEAGDLRCSICGQVAPLLAGAAKQLAVTVLRCDGCGAAVSYDASVQAPRCGFCTSVMHVEEIEDPMEQTRAYLPFSVSGSDARQSLRTWQKSLGFFRPGDLSSASSVESLRPIWWTCWVFDADALVSWTADSNAGSGRSAWAPHSGQEELTFDDLVVPATRGLTTSETSFLANTYDFDSVDDEPAGLESGLDPVVEQFDVQRSAARSAVLSAIQATVENTVEGRLVPGSRCRNVNAEILLRGLVTRRLAAPAWVLAYRYKGELYRVVISGQDAGAVSGHAPYSWAKILGVIVGSVLLLGVIAAIIAAAAG